MEKGTDWWSSVCEIKIALTSEKFNNHAKLGLPCVVSDQNPMSASKKAAYDQS